MGSPTFTTFHVAVSLFAIVSGFVVWVGLTQSRRQNAWVAAFSLTSAATYLTGYFFHREAIQPSHVVGAIALVVLAVTTVARYLFDLRGRWRVIFSGGMVLSLWFNVFVLVVQAFLKIPALHAFAPKGSEPPFAVVQIFVFALFVIYGVRAVRRFQPAPPKATH